MTAQTRVARGRTQGRAPGVRHRTSMPITQDEAAMLDRFWGEEDLGPGFETFEGGAEPALSAEPDIIYGGVQGPALSLPGIGPITPEEAEAVARFMDDGEGGFDGPATPAMTVVPKGGAPRAATAHEAAQGRPPMVTQTVGSGRLPNPAAPVAGSEEADEELGWDDYAKDIFYSAGTGLAEGAIGLAGLAGDVQDLARTAARKAGVDPSVLDYVPGGDLLRRDWWGSEELRDAVEDKIGPFYEPKTKVGEFTRTIGEFAPAAFVPGGLVARAANVAVPALLSEGAGQVAREWSPEHEGLARFAGAVSGALTPRGMAKALKAVPKSAKHTQAVDALKGKGVRSLTAGQELGSARLQRLERYLGDPVKFEPQNAEFTRAVLKRIGAHGDEASPAVLGKAAGRIERNYIEGSRRSLDAFRRANRDKQNLGVVKRAVAAGPHPGGKRHITPERLVAGETADNVALGRGGFSDLIEAGERVMVPPAPSGLTGHAVRTAVSGLGGAVGGTPGAVLGAVAGPPLAGKALMSRPVQTYLRRDLIPQSQWGNTARRAGLNSVIGSQTQFNTGEG